MSQSRIPALVLRDTAAITGLWARNQTAKAQPWKKFWPLKTEAFSAAEKKEMPWLTWKFNPAKPEDKPWRAWMLKNEATVVRRGSW